MKVAVVVAGLLAVAGCDPERAEPALVDVAPPALRVTPASGGVADKRALLLLANTPDALYRIDPTTLAVTELGRFTFPDGVAEAITDVAMDPEGRIWATGFEGVYRVDPVTLACTRLATHAGHSLNALSIMTAAMKGSRERGAILVAAEALSSTVYEVDPTTGALTVIGDLGPGLRSSGDLTWAPGVGAVMVVTDRAGYEGLATLDPVTFTAHPRDRGWAFEKVRGLTLLPEALLGLSEHGELIVIDPRTGAATRRETHGLVFFGGAVGWEVRAAKPATP